ASKVSPTNGNKEYEVDANGIKPKAEAVKPAGIAGKPMKFVPRSVNSAFKPPVVLTDSESVSSLPFGPADYEPSSFRRASSDHTTPSGSSISPEKLSTDAESTLPSKKRVRNQPKRFTKKTKTGSLSPEE
ncbi:hypothetical protein DFH28DRAFT_882135, partial [Melampsora americana]